LQTRIHKIWTAKIDSFSSGRHLQEISALYSSFHAELHILLFKIANSGGRVKLRLEKHITAQAECFENTQAEPILIIDLQMLPKYIAI
jgi:hypothetical protein